MANRGSPPPMRGKVLEKGSFLRRTGITPAYAGKSLSGVQCTCRTTDHPRLCGEKYRKGMVLFGNIGSPPPMRGKEMPRGQGVLHFRITPAYAGKRMPSVLSDFKHRDHPRLCGEKLPTHCVVCYGKRITPAYAGKSLLKSWRNMMR